MACCGEAAKYAHVLSVFEAIVIYAGPNEASRKMRNGERAVFLRRRPIAHQESIYKIISAEIARYGALILRSRRLLS